MTSRTAYRLGLGLAVFAVLVTLWLMGAVGIVGAEGDRADLPYLGALGVAVVGAVVVRFRAGGMSVVMGVTAIAMLAVGLATVVAGGVPAYNSPFEVLGLSGGFAGLFVGSAWLFRRAAGAPASR